MGLNDTFHFYIYTSDNTQPYIVKMSDLDATAGGFTTQVDPASGAVWGYGAKNMRHVMGVDSAGKRTRLACATNAVSLYQTGGTFSLRGRTYTVEGQIGEKRKVNHIG